jgi:hypothetical protein
VSISDKPKCIPPKEAAEYEYLPRPLIPLPPMLLEGFIHYLEHSDIYTVILRRTCGYRDFLRDSIRG